jgi:hypothetical protein
MVAFGSGIETTRSIPDNIQPLYQPVVDGNALDYRNAYQHRRDCADLPNAVPRRSPGTAYCWATLATALWFLATTLFSMSAWLRDYSIIYGSLGVGTRSWCDVHDLVIKRLALNSMPCCFHARSWGRNC